MIPRKFPDRVNRAVDYAADALLVELAIRVKAEDPEFNSKKEVERLQDQIEYLTELKIKSCFPQVLRAPQNLCTRARANYALEEWKKDKRNANTIPESLL